MLAYDHDVRFQHTPQPPCSFVWPLLLLQYPIILAATGRAGNDCLQQGLCVEIKSLRAVELLELQITEPKGASSANDCFLGRSIFRRVQRRVHPIFID